MFEQLSDLENLLFNRSGKSPFAKLPSKLTQESGSGSEPLSFMQVLQQIAETPSKTSGELLTASITSLFSQAFLASKQTAPVIAVAGVLNAGKSSLVASFLSPSARERLLIGSSNHEGTHRFILWLPESWRKDDALWQNTLTQITSVFGFPPEELASDSPTASDQYNGRLSPSYSEQYPSTLAVSSILVPLVATDSWLDSHGIGLMDCPDIQTGFLADESVLGVSTTTDSSHHNLRTDTTQTLFAASRRTALSKALQISSAFVVVTSANSIQDQVVSDILSIVQTAMPGLRTMMAVNRVPRRYTSAEISNEIAMDYGERGLWRVYMAYHFDGPLLRERIPILRFKDSTLTAAPDLPVFFRIDKSPPTQPPNDLNHDDFLVSIGEQLDPSRLSKERLDATLISLKVKILEGLNAIEKHNQKSLTRRSRWHNLLAQAIFRLSTQSKSNSTELDSIRLQVSRELIQQISTSLEKTAPWWAKPGRLAIRWSSKVQEAASHATNWIRLPTWITNRTSAVSEFVTSRWRTGDGGRVISPRDFFDTVAAQDLSFGLLDSRYTHNRELWEERYQHALQRFKSESCVRLSDEQLDEYTAQMWRGMDLWQSFLTGVAPAGLLFAPIVAAAMLPFEGGTTAMLTITLKEFLGAGLATVGLSIINKDTMPKLAEEETAWSQMSELFAVCCDEMGVIRPGNDDMPHLHFKNMDRSLLPATLPVACKEPIDHSDFLYSTSPTTVQNIKNALI